MRIAVGGGELAYDEAGSGPVVVLVHAGLADRRMWEHQFCALAARFRVIRYDWRGYGESDDATSAVSRHEDLLGLLDALAIDRAALIGSSYGGAHAIDTALAAPERVTALGLICSGLSGHDVWTPEMQALAAEKAPSGIPAERLKRYDTHTADTVDPADITAMAASNVRLMVVGPYREPDVLDADTYALALDMCRGVYRREWQGPDTGERAPERPAAGRLAEVRVPTLVVNGTSDLPAVRHIADILARGITGARRIDLPTGHLPSLERPAELTAMLIDFLSVL
jgi:pimeloyl-ACP methyl ester carboxylesterase